MRELRDQLGVEVAHAPDEGDDGRDHLNEPQRRDHLLQPRPDLVEIRSERRSDPLARSHLWLQWMSGALIPGSDDFLRSERGVLPSRSTPSPREVDAFHDQRPLGGLDRD
jgi:hypothetical protein